MPGTLEVRQSAYQAAVISQRTVIVVALTRTQDVELTRNVPTSDRKHDVAATAEAAYFGKQSTIYVWLVRKMLTMPNPNGIKARMGTILLFVSAKENFY